MHKIASLSVASVSSPLIHDHERRYVCYSDASIQWQRLDESPMSGLKIKVICKPAAKNCVFYSIGYMGQGADGQAWLVRDYEGSVFVCKFAKSGKDESYSLDAEFENWDKFYRNLVQEGLVFLRRFGPGKVPALIMPRFALVRQSSHSDQAIITAVRAEIKRIAQLKMVHNDLKWRHVGLYKDGDNLCAVFFDLARVARKPEKDATQIMMDALKNDCKLMECTGSCNFMKQ